MSNDVRNLVELTHIKGLVKKCVLLHIADTVRADLLFWRSQINVAKRLGTDAKTVRNNLRTLCADGFIQYIGDKVTPTGHVAIYRVVLETLLARPSIDITVEDLRAEMVQKMGRGCKPCGEGLTPPEPEAENPTNHNYPLDSYISAENKNSQSYDGFDRLDNDLALNEWIEELTEVNHG